MKYIGFAESNASLGWDYWNINSTLPRMEIRLCEGLEVLCGNTILCTIVSFNLFVIFGIKYYCSLSSLTEFRCTGCKLYGNISRLGFIAKYNFKKGFVNIGRETLNFLFASCFEL